MPNGQGRLVVTGLNMYILNKKKRKCNNNILFNFIFGSCQKQCGLRSLTISFAVEPLNLKKLKTFYFFGYIWILGG